MWWIVSLRELRGREGLEYVCACEEGNAEEGEEKEGRGKKKDVPQVSPNLPRRPTKHHPRGIDHPQPPHHVNIPRYDRWRVTAGMEEVRLEVGGKGAEEEREGGGLGEAEFEVFEGWGGGGVGEEEGVDLG